MARKKKRKRTTKMYPGAIDRHGAGWRVRLCIGGKYTTYAVDGTRQEAENYAVEKYKELTDAAEREKIGLPGQIAFSQLLREFRQYGLPRQSGRTYGQSLANFERYFVERLGDPHVRDLRRSHIMSFLEWRATQSATGRVTKRTAADGAEVTEPRPVSWYTTAKDFRVLRRLFNYAISKDYVDANPAAQVRAPKGDHREPVILTADEYERLLTKCEHNPMLHLWVLMLGETGMRAFSEALRVQWNDVDLVGGSITIMSGRRDGERTKSGRARVVPMTKRLHEAMKAHAAAYRFRSPLVFHHEVTARNVKAGSPIKTLRTSFEAAVKAAKLPDGFRAHDLRHRRVTTWLGESKSPALIQLAMGHAAIATTMSYAHLTSRHLRSLVDDEPITTAAVPTAAPMKEATAG